MFQLPVALDLCPAKGNNYPISILNRLPRPLEPTTLARGGDGQVKHALADAQIGRDPFVDLGSISANLLLFNTGPGRSPTGPMSASFSLFWLLPCFLSVRQGNHRIPGKRNRGQAKEEKVG